MNQQNAFIYLLHKKKGDATLKGMLQLVLNNACKECMKVYQLTIGKVLPHEKRTFQKRALKILGQLIEHYKTSQLA